MAKIANVTVCNFKSKFFKKLDYSYTDISGVEIVNIKVKSEKHKKRLARFLTKNGVEYAITPMEIGVPTIDGRELLRSVYPEIVTRYAKSYGGYTSASVYADRLDAMAQDVIFLLCDKFKYISVFTSDYNKDKFFDEVLCKKGVMLMSFYENENEAAFVLSDKMPERKNIVDLKTGTGIKIYTPDKKVITPALCEAVIKAKTGSKGDLRSEFLRLKYKVI